MSVRLFLHGGPHGCVLKCNFAKAVAANAFQQAVEITLVIGAFETQRVGLKDVVF